MWNPGGSTQVRSRQSANGSALGPTESWSGSVLAELQRDRARFGASPSEGPDLYAIRERDCDA